MPTEFAYIRVSSRDQNEDRPQYRKLVRRLKPDDLVYIKSIDRWGAIMRKFWNSGEF